MNDTLRIYCSLLTGWLLLCWASVGLSADSSVTVESWVSSQDMRNRLARQAPLRFAAERARIPDAITIDATRTYQSILGLGSSLEHSTCYNISKLDKKQQEQVMESLVDPERGIGMSLMRICIGTPDFTGSPWYSYDDMPPGQTDPQMKHFSVEKDRQYVLPILKLALRKNPSLVFFASPWSPPAWMKTSGSLCGGRIDPGHFTSFARYMIRFIEAYQAEGIKIHAVTVQNEPHYAPNSYPTCRWTGAQQRDFIRDHLGPALQAGALDTKIWCWDHNFNNVEFATAILKDTETARYVDGTAFHHYEGEPSAMSTLRERFPDKHLYFTEGSVFGMEGAAQIIAFMRNWARCYNAWVTIIDDEAQPNPGPHDCSPTCIVLNSKKLTLEYRFDYYMYGQFMKFIRPGAVRIHSNIPSKSLPNVALRNPDGSIVLVVANLGRSSADFGIEWKGKRLTTMLGGESVVTYRWQGS